MSDRIFSISGTIPYVLLGLVPYTIPYVRECPLERTLSPVLIDIYLI